MSEYSPLHAYDHVDHKKLLNHLLSPLYVNQNFNLELSNFHV